jgi:membrane dipeptidase
LHRESIVVDLVSQHAGWEIFHHYPAHLQSELRATVERTLAGMKDDPELVAEAVYWPYEMSKQGRSHLICDWYRASGLTCGTYDIGVHDGWDPMWTRWEAVNKRYADLRWMKYITTTTQIRQAKRDDVVAFYGFCQPQSPAPRNLKAFDAAYARGLRSFMLTYNQMDNIGVGCTERVDAGLSRFGLDVVRHCNDIGIVIDVSHCGHLTTMDACRHSTAPVNANHTCARHIHEHARAKQDDGLKAIADTGGVIGVLAVPFFLSDLHAPTIEHMLDHIDYIADLVGWRHVAIGTDWPLQYPVEILTARISPDNPALGFRKQDKLDPLQRLIGFNDCRDLANITRGLVKRGYDDEQIRGILGENALRVFAEVWGE